MAKKHKNRHFLAAFNNFDPLTYNIVNALLLILLELFDDIFKKEKMSKFGFNPKITFFSYIYPLFSYICQNGW